MSHFQDGIVPVKALPQEVVSVENCFDDMERPNFAYRVKIMTKEDEPCTVDFENPDQTTCQLSKDVNEGQNVVERWISNDHAQSRQTGEGFRSAAPPDCRIEVEPCDTVLV